MLCIMDYYPILSCHLCNVSSNTITSLHYDWSIDKHKPYSIMLVLLHIDVQCKYLGQCKYLAYQCMYII